MRVYIYVCAYTLYVQYILFVLLCVRKCTYIQCVREGGGARGDVLHVQFRTYSLLGEGGGWL